MVYLFDLFYNSEVFHISNFISLQKFIHTGSLKPRIRVCTVIYIHNAFFIVLMDLFYILLKYVVEIIYFDCVKIASKK